MSEVDSPFALMGNEEMQKLLPSVAVPGTMLPPDFCANGTTYSLPNDTRTLCVDTMAEAPIVALPPEMTFTEGNVVSVIAYTCIFIISAIGNLTVFITLFRNRQRKSRVNLFIMNLSVADLIVTFVMVPLETGWHMTVQWTAGDFACRILMFFRAFGFYLSSFILVTISLDRYFAIVHPLSLNGAAMRGKIMLGFSWFLSVVVSIPQSIIFHVESHPVHNWYKQCVTFNFFPSVTHEMVYNVFNLLTVYGVPLVIIVLSYTRIVCEIYKKTRERREETNFRESQNGSTCERLRRSGMGNIERARIRTLKMTITIVLVFIVCWTPYFVINIWFWIDSESAKKVDNKIQAGLFLFAVSNSCMDPIVYGMFTINFKKELGRCCLPRKAFFRHSNTPSTRTVLLKETSSSSSGHVSGLISNGASSKPHLSKSRHGSTSSYALQNVATNALYGGKLSVAVRETDLAKRTPPDSPCGMSPDYANACRTPREAINDFRLP